MRMPCRSAGITSDLTVAQSSGRSEITAGWRIVGLMTVPGQKYFRDLIIRGSFISFRPECQRAFEFEPEQASCVFTFAEQNARGLIWAGRHDIDTSF